VKAVRYRKYGGPNVLELVDVEPPQAGPGQIRIMVRAAGVNGLEAKIRSGLMATRMATPFPSGTGMDASGVVDEIGAGVDSVKIGDPVFGWGKDTYAEQAVMTAWAAKPSRLSFAEAAGFPVPVETADRFLRDLNARPGQSILLNGASGGVGTALIQLAVHRRLRVIGLASARNQDYMRSFGAEVTTYGEGFQERVRTLVPGGIDLAADLAGNGVLSELVELTGDAATVITIADFAGAARHGVRASAEMRDPVPAFLQAANLFETGHLRLPVERTFELAEAGAAQAVVEAGHAAGRTVIVVD